MNSHENEELKRVIMTLDKGEIKKLLTAGYKVQYVITERAMVEITPAHTYSLILNEEFDLYEISLQFAHVDELWYCYDSKHYLPEQIDRSIDLFVDIAEKRNDKWVSDEKSNWIYELIAASRSTLLIGSHYEYLDAVISKFWHRVFGTDFANSPYCGIVTAHGDKCYSYRRKWKESGISFQHGTLLFMLTYTNLMDMERYESAEWVIKNYEKYKKVINGVDKEVLKEITDRCLASS